MVKHFLLFSLVGVVVAGVAFQRAGTKTPETPELAAPSTDADNVIHVGALRLWRDYEENELAADARYRDRRLRVTGTVLSIEKTFDGDPELNLASGNPIFRTLARLDKSEIPRAAALSPMTRVVVECRAGERLLKMVMLEECSLISP